MKIVSDVVYVHYPKPHDFQAHTIVKSHKVAYFRYLMFYVNYTS